MNYEYVLDKGEFQGWTKSIIKNGVDIYSGETKKEIIKQGYKVATSEEVDKLRIKYENALTGEWSKITENKYDDMMCCLPPMEYINGGFYMCEMYTGNISSFYQQLGDNYYTSLQRLSTPRAEILDNLNKYIIQSLGRL